MNTKEIENLLTRYFNGDTSLGEEFQLKTYFSTEKAIPLHLQEYAPIFGFFSGEGKITPSADLEAKITEKVISGKVRPLFSTSLRKPLVLAIAASFLLLVGIVTLLRTGVFSPADPYGTISDPELAYVEARNALMSVSEKFNTGLAKAGGLASFDRGIRQAEKLRQFNQYQPIIINPDESPK